MRKNDMKPFKINRNSWHYKLNTTFMNEYTYDMDTWEYRNNNFCSYWRSTMIRVVGFVLGLTLLSTFVIVTISAAIANPIGALVTLLMLATLIAVFAAIVYISNRPAKQKAPTSLLVQKYVAYKSRICPGVDFED